MNNIYQFFGKGLAIIIIAIVFLILDFLGVVDIPDFYIEYVYYTMLIGVGFLIFGYYMSRR